MERVEEQESSKVRIFSPRSSTLADKFPPRPLPIAATPIFMLAGTGKRRDHVNKTAD